MSAPGEPHKYNSFDFLVASSLIGVSLLAFCTCALLVKCGILSYRSIRNCYNSGFFIRWTNGDPSRQASTFDEGHQLTTTKTKSTSYTNL